MTCYICQDFTRVTSRTKLSTTSVKSISRELASNFWEKNIFDNIRERSRQKGLQRACESYIHDIICWQSVVNEVLTSIIRLRMT